jgi:Secretion system C-terminal sorting domain/Pregnancy-associated plasma protein-A
MLNKRFLVSLVFLISAFFSHSQHIHNKNCGVSIEDQLTSEMLHPNDFKGDVSSLRNNTIYVPIKFHLTANDDGSGRLDYIHVLNQLCILNRDYGSSNIVFYIYEGFSLINQTNIYQAAGTNRNAVQAKKDGKAINVFITQNADLDNNSSGGTTLGFYSPQGDYVVIRKQELASLSNTLSHEIGHFFNLRHTFYGWEGVPYNKDTHGQTVTFTTVPGGIANVPVELVDGSNCLTAADMICDTPPDYNFGLTSSNCAFNIVVFDRNNDRIFPMKENQMGYFQDCDTFKFTEGQIDRMLINYNSTSRNYLKSSYIPNVTEIADAPILNTPLKAEKISGYTNVQFDWEDVPGATTYLIEIKGSNQYYSALTTLSEYTAPELKKNNTYFWTVKPFNDAFGCSPVTTSNFRTGDGTSSIYEVSKIKNIVITPNPVNNSSVAQITLHTNEADNAQIEVLSMVGQRLITFTYSLQAGQNTIPLGTKELNTGVYMLNIKVNGRNSFAKFVVH